MTKKFCQWLLYKRLGWTKDVTEDHPDKYIICLAPHTSNWDFLLGQLYMRAEGYHINFMMKKEWFKWPLGPLFKRMGGIPVWRTMKTSLTDNLAETAKNEKQFHLCITPEGTRSLNAEWKKGFYFIALKAGIPILLYGIDYERKLIQCTRTVVPTGNVDEEMREIQRYFINFKGKHPELFATGNIQDQ
ncbi:MAG: 1-acyl-sn-glycerol-3-phosphate acyltransferase [Prevotella sp.]|nr:1-acyl-sn-glycerol-3-phosphate acyltransferase [Prevotella sp.]